MSSKWPLVKLGDILKRVERFESRNELIEYHFAGTYSFARGIFAGERKMGSSFALPKIQRIHSGDFVYCKIMAWEGAFGLVPQKADGCVMSGAFVVYKPYSNLIDPIFLDYFFKIPNNWKTIGKQSTGTNVRRQSLHPNQFENALIPLPPLAEQQRIVARIESLAARITEAQKLREEANKETKKLSQSVLRKVFNKNNWGNQILNEIAPINMGQSPPGDSYNFDKYGVPLLNGPTEFGDKHPIPKQWTTSPTKYCKAGDILICVRATIGKMNWADQEYCIGRGLAAISVNVAKCVPKYVYYFIETQTQELLSRTAGSTFPNLQGEKLKKLAIPVPPIEEQHRIVTYLDNLHTKIQTIHTMQTQTSTELNAMLPAILDRAFKGEL